MYELAKDYYIKNGNLLIPQIYQINGVNFGRWILAQRQNFRDNNLSIEDIKKLELIDMVWNTNKLKKLDKVLNNIKIFDRQYLLALIYDVIKIYEKDAIKKFLILSNMDSDYDLDNIIKVLKNNMDDDSYQILINYLFGIDINDLSNIYILRVNEIEKIRLYGMKLIFENCLENNTEKNIKIKS